MKKLTKRQREVLLWIKRHIKKKGYAPTNKEIADHFEMYPNAAFEHLKALVKLEAIRVVPKIARGIVIVD